MSEGGKLIRRLLPFERNYTVVPNPWVRDDKLSFKARGILVLLLSHTHGWSVTLKQLAQDAHVGVDSVRSGVEELEKRGYLIRRTSRRGMPDDWELCDPTGLSDPALIGYAGVRTPVDNSTLEYPTRQKTRRYALGNPTRHALGNPTSIEDQLKNNSLPSPATVGAGWAVDNTDASGDSHRPASASKTHCANGHPFIGASGGGVPFCARSCSPVDLGAVSPSTDRITA